MHRCLPRRAPTALAIALAMALPLHAAEFVFEGELQDGGAPASGLYDLQLTPYADAQSALPLGAATEFPLVEVIDGRFRVSLDLPGHTDAPALAVAVRDGGAKSAYSPLPGRQQAKAGPIGVCWSTTGDEGAVPGTHFIGTTDGVPFELRAGGSAVLRLLPTGGAPNILAGNSGNSITGAGSVASVIGGGGNVQNPNVIETAFATISGGSGNRVSGASGTVSGGFGNQATGLGAAVGGGFENRAEGDQGTVGGGKTNVASGNLATVAGGENNTAGGQRSAILGGFANAASGNSAAVGGGQWNGSPGNWSTVPGGIENCAGGQLSFAAGFRAKVRRGADSPSAGLGCQGIATIPGSEGDRGTFVWADGQGADFVSTGPNQFLVRATGGFAINSNAVPGNTDLFVNSRTVGQNADLLLKVRGVENGINIAATNTGTLFIARADVSNPDVPVYTDYAQWSGTGQFRLFVDNPIKPTGGGFSAPSDARLKQHIAPLTESLNRLLALRGTTFEYLPSAPKGFYTPGVQTGFIAQEVEKVFPEWVSTDPSGYKLVGIKGFEALAVEALRELRQEKVAEIDTLQRQLDEQREANAALEARLARIESALAGRVR